MRTTNRRPRKRKRESLRKLYRPLRIENLPKRDLFAADVAFALVDGGDHALAEPDSILDGIDRGAQISKTSGLTAAPLSSFELPVGSEASANTAENRLAGGASARHAVPEVPQRPLQPGSQPAPGLYPAGLIDSVAKVFTTIAKPVIQFVEPFVAPVIDFGKDVLKNALGINESAPPAPIVNTVSNMVSNVNQNDNNSSATIGNVDTTTVVAMPTDLPPSDAQKVSVVAANGKPAGNSEATLSIDTPTNLAPPPTIVDTDTKPVDPHAADEKTTAATTSHVAPADSSESDTPPTPNSAPRPRIDVESVTLGQALEGNVLRNDTGRDLLLLSINQPKPGQGVIRSQPQGNFTFYAETIGLVELPYRVADEFGSAWSTLYINVNPEAPRAITVVSTPVENATTPPRVAPPVVMPQIPGLSLVPANPIPAPLLSGPVSTAPLQLKSPGACPCSTAAMPARALTTDVPYILDRLLETVDKFTDVFSRISGGSSPATQSAPLGPSIEPLVTDVAQSSHNRWPYKLPDVFMPDTHWRHRSVRHGWWWSA